MYLQYILHIFVCPNVCMCINTFLKYGYGMGSLCVLVLCGYYGTIFYNKSGLISFSLLLL